MLSCSDWFLDIGIYRLVSNRCCFIDGDEHDHDQDLVGMGAPDHLEKEGLVPLITEDPGELASNYIYIYMKAIVFLFCQVCTHLLLAWHFG